MLQINKYSSSPHIGNLNNFLFCIYHTSKKSCVQESSKSNTMSPLSTLSPGDMLSPASNLHTSKV